MKKQISLRMTAALCVLCAAVSVGTTAIVVRSPLSVKLSQIEKVVKKHYVGDYEIEDAVDTAAMGYVLGVGDRWSSYLNQEDYETYQLSFAGKLVGIGVTVTASQTEDEIIITDVYDGSPAANAGLKPRDVLLGADGKTVAEDGYDAVTEAMRGEEGSVVVVRVRRADTSEEEVLEITRKMVDKTVVRGRMLDGKIGYLTIRDFDGGADIQFEAARNALLEQGAEKLIFDVRFNPGGSVDVLAKILDPLVPEGTIMRLENKKGEGKSYLSDAAALDIPMAVIVNARSISAAEFFAAALQEYEKAVIVGDQTIGKGYSQRQYRLLDGSAVILSDQKYYTPQGKNLADIGVVPDIKVSLSEEAYQNYFFLSDEEDIQLQAAIQALDQT